MRAFVFAAVLVACSSSGAGQVSAQHSAGGAEAAGALVAPSGGSDVGGGSGGTALARVCDPGRSESCACSDGAIGAQVCAADGQSWEACACEGAAGSAGAAAGGAPAIGGAPSAGSAGAMTGGGGSAGSSDPLGPFPAPGCQDWTAYRIPQGKFLAVTGSFEATSLKKGVCQVLGGSPAYEACGAAGNVMQCVCTVTSSPSCGQYCDGAYLVTVLRAAPGKTYKATLEDGNGACIKGVPTRTDTP